MIYMRTRLMIAGITMAIVAATYVQESAAEAAVRETTAQRSDFEALRLQVQAQARRIKSLERVTARQNAELNWFRECTPQALNIGATLDVPLANAFGRLGLRWEPLAQANIWTLALHPSCVQPSVSGFPFG